MGAINTKQLHYAFTGSRLGEEEEEEQKMKGSDNQGKPQGHKKRWEPGQSQNLGHGGSNDFGSCGNIWGKSKEQQENSGESESKENIESGEFGDNFSFANQAGAAGVDDDDEEELPFQVRRKQPIQVTRILPMQVQGELPMQVQRKLPIQVQRELPSQVDRRGPIQFMRNDNEERVRSRYRESVPVQFRKYT